MKKLFFIILTITISISCKDLAKQVDSTENNTEALSTLKGNFIYFADGAVLQTETEVYGVVINKKMHDLANQVQKYKVEDTDMVPVEIRGKIIPKPKNDEGWPFQVEINEILKISKPSPKDNNTIKI